MKRIYSVDYKENDYNHSEIKTVNVVAGNISEALERAAVYAKKQKSWVRPIAHKIERGEEVFV